MSAGSQFIYVCHDAIASICQDFPAVQRCKGEAKLLGCLFGLTAVRRVSEKALHTAADDLSRIWHHSQGKGVDAPRRRCRVQRGP